MYKLIVWCVVSLLLACAFPDTSSASPRSAQAINKAITALQADKPQEALDLVMPFTEGAKPNVSVLLVAGNAFMRLEKPEQALKMYEIGSKCYPEHIGITQNKAIALYELERLVSAGKCFMRLATLQRQKPSEKKDGGTPDWYKSQYQATACYYRAERYDLALKAILPLQKYTEFKEHTDTQKLLAHVYIATKKWKKAKTELLALVKRHPTERTFWILLAEVNIRSERLKKAAVALQVAYQLKPPTKTEAIRLARLYLQVDAPLLASKSILASTEKLSGSDYDLLAVAYERAGEYSQASKALEDAIQYKATPKRHFELGKLLYRNQEYAEAIPPLLIALKKQKKKKGLTYYILGQCFVQTKQHDKAKKMFAKATKYRNIRAHAKHSLTLLSNIEKLKKGETL